MKLTFVAMALLTIGCGLNPPPVPIPTPPPVQTHQANASIYDEAAAPVTDATCTLDHDVDTAAGEAPVRETATGWRQSFTYASPPVREGWGATLTCTSPSYVTTVTRLSPLVPGEQVVAPMKAARVFWGEFGWLRVEGVRFVHESGQDWRYAGYSAFPYLQQFCAGQDIGPLVDDAAETGARVFRTLGMFEGGLGSFRTAALDHARFETCALGYMRYMASRGLRVEFVVFADAQNVMPDPAFQREHFERLSSILSNEWNVLGELCNECEKNGVDPARFNKPATRVLWSRGSGLGAEDPAHPAWDYATYHEARDDEYPRKNECRPYMTDDRSPIKGIPCVQDEPIGASEVNQPGRRAGAVNGDPTRAILDFGQMGANFGLQSPGGLFHSDAGLSGGLLGPVQKQMAVAFFKGLTFAPPSAQTWAYQRGDNCGDCDGIGGMPLAQKDLPDAQGTLRTFCRSQGSSSWCVEVRRAGGQPQARAGWRIADQPFPGLVRLAR